LIPAVLPFLIIAAVQVHPTVAAAILAAVDHLTAAVHLVTGNPNANEITGWLKHEGR